MQYPKQTDNYDVEIFNANFRELENKAVDQEAEIAGMKANFQTQLAGKANTASPTLTGTPKVPTANDGTNTTQIANTAFVQSTVLNHNVSTEAHSDIRELISALATRLNALADSDDTTLDQLSELVAYIKSNRSLIENVTTNKVNVSDIADNLTSTAVNKPLSANQGRALKELISVLTSVVEALPSESFKGATASSAGNMGYVPAPAAGVTNKYLKSDGTWGDGVQGEAGETGEDGISIKSVNQTTTSTADGGTNVITVELSDGTKSTFSVKNGSKGSTGATGATGPTGATGAAGAKGATGTRGSLIYWGTAITGTSTTAKIFSGTGITSALVNDLYLNTSTWNIYQCTTAGAASAAKWVYKGNIKGATGATGATGPAGATGTTLTATLAAGATSVSFTNSAITSTSMIDVYTDVFGVNPTAMSVSGTTLKITFDAQTVAVSVKIRVW